MLKILIFISVIVCSTTFLIGCANDTLPEVSGTVDLDSQAGDSKPINEVGNEQFVSPVSPVTLPEETEVSVQPPEIPTPEAGTGVVYGIAGSPSSERGRVFSVGSSVYLARLNYTQNEDGTPIVPLASVRVDEDPSQPLHEQEYFVFSNIPPGEYAFILVSPVDNYIIPGDHSSGFKVVEVSDGDIIDIGELPLP